MSLDLMTKHLINRSMTTNSSGGKSHVVRLSFFQRTQFLVHTVFEFLQALKKTLRPVRPDELAFWDADVVDVFDEHGIGIDRIEVADQRAMTGRSQDQAAGLVTQELAVRIQRNRIGGRILMAEFDLE